MAEERDTRGGRGEQPRILGYTRRMAGPVVTRTWEPPTQEEVEALPLLPSPPQRGWTVEARAKTRQAGRAAAGADASAPGAAPFPGRGGSSRQEGAPSSPPLAPPPPAPPPAGAVPPPPSGAAAPPPPAAEPSSPTAKPEWIEAGSVQEEIWNRLDDAAQLVRSWLSEAGEGGGEKSEARRRQIAEVMLALGSEIAGEILRRLTDEEIEQVSVALAASPRLDPDRRTSVLEELRQALRAGRFAITGGPAYARSLLERAVGPHRAREILGRAVGRAGAGFRLLGKCSPEQVAPFLSHEHPQTIALILSQLEPAAAAVILSHLPGEMQGDVARRMARMGRVPARVIREVAEDLEASLRDLLEGDQSAGGAQVVAEVLNLADSSTKKRVLEKLEAQEPEVAEEVRNQMFVFNDLARLTDREIQQLLREVEMKDLVIALKGADPATRKKILGNMSEKAAATIREEMEFLGPMRRSEVEEVQRRIIRQARQMEEQGLITLVRTGDDPLV